MANGPSTENFTLYRGTAWLIRVTIRNAAGAIQNVSGWTSKFVMRKTRTSPDPVTFQASGTVVGDGSGGQIEYSATKAQTLAIAARDYEYGIERTNAGFEDLVTTGTITVAYDVVNAK
jgi:hypothetical protein